MSSPRFSDDLRLNALRFFSPTDLDRLQLVSSRVHSLIEHNASKLAGRKVEILYGDWKSMDTRYTSEHLPPACVLIIEVRRPQDPVESDPRIQLEPEEHLRLEHILKRGRIANVRFLYIDMTPSAEILDAFACLAAAAIPVCRVYLNLRQRLNEPSSVVQLPVTLKTDELNVNGNATVLRCEAAKRVRHFTHYFPSYSSKHYEQVAADFLFAPSAVSAHRRVIFQGQEDYDEERSVKKFLQHVVERFRHGSDGEEFVEDVLVYGDFVEEEPIRVDFLGPPHARAVRVEWTRLKPFGNGDSDYNELTGELYDVYYVQAGNGKTLTLLVQVPAENRDLVCVWIGNGRVDMVAR